MNEPDYQEIVRSMRSHTTHMERSGGYWTPEEQRELDYLFNNGVGLTEIAIRLQRTELAVIQQIEKQDLYQRNLYRQRRRSNREHCTCLCDRCGLYPECCPYRTTLTDVREDT